MLQVVSTFYCFCVASCLLFIVSVASCLLFIVFVLQVRAFFKDFPVGGGSGGGGHSWKGTFMVSILN